MAMSAEAAASLAKGVHSVSRGEDQYSQASNRMYRIFTDQWGREFGADVEKATMHPCGPWHPRFTAPLMPPHKYVVVTDTMRGMVFIDCVRWIHDLLEAFEYYEQFKMEHATRMFGAKAHEAMEEGDMHPALLRVVGSRPMPDEVIRAMRAGNRWILGLLNDDGTTPEKPEKAPRDFFPDIEDVRRADPLRDYDPWATPEGAVTGEADAAPVEYPDHIGGGWWLLSASHAAAYGEDKVLGFRGTREQALQAIKDGVEPEPAPETTDPDW